MPEKAGEPSADFGVRSGLSVTSVLHRHKRECAGGEIGTRLPAEAPPRRLFLFSLFLGFLDNLLHCVEKLFDPFFRRKRKRRYRRRTLAIVPNNFHDFQEIITTIVNKKLNY
jgi:hypothetical protein